MSEFNQVFAAAQIASELGIQVSVDDVPKLVAALHRAYGTGYRDAAGVERDRICRAIKAEDDYCVDNGDYMLDSDDCIAVAQGTWNRPDFNLEVPA